MRWPSLTFVLNNILSWKISSAIDLLEANPVNGLIPFVHLLCINSYSSADSKAKN